MIGAKARAAVLLAWDVAVVLLTDRNTPTCAEELGPLACERRQGHRGQHAMLTAKVSGVWGRKR